MNKKIILSALALLALTGCGAAQKKQVLLDVSTVLEKAKGAADCDAFRGYIGAIDGLVQAELSKDK